MLGREMYTLKCTLVLIPRNPRMHNPKHGEFGVGGGGVHKYAATGKKLTNGLDSHTVALCGISGGILRIPLVAEPWQ